MRVIIAGAGPAGLVLGHALSKANIDFVILEGRENPVEESGAGLGLWPHSVRVMDQLGLLEALTKITTRLEKSIHLGPNGEFLNDSDMFDMIAANHGHDFLCFERTQFLRVLYDNLPDNRARVLTGKVVQSIAQDSSSVTVTCTDGSTHTADLLVGADGVHSAVRRFILPGTSSSGNGNDSDDQQMSGPFQSTYKCIFGLSPTPAALPTNQMIEVHDHGVSWHLLTMPERTAWFIFVRKDKASNTSRRYTEAEAEEVASLYASHSLWQGGAFTFGDLWRTRSQAKLVDLEEGILDQWYAGRAVLLGDCVHKMTPNMAMGCNNAIESAAVLANLLHGIASQDGAGTQIPTENLESVFAEYQRQRFKRASSCVSSSGFYTQFAAWDNWLLAFAGRYIAPLLGAKMVVDYVFAPIPTGGRVLDFVAEENRKEGKFRWHHEGKRLEPSTQSLVV